MDDFQMGRALRASREWRAEDILVVESVLPSEREMADDIQDFAATTMNELLGWYGYEKLDSRGLYLKGATPTSSSSSSPREEELHREDTPRTRSPLENAGTSESVSLRELSGEAPRRSRACDWCRLSRHTVSQVDLLDGEERLQFCSSKCLNQYKMHIFCRETQAYLQSNPLNGHQGEDSKLITPDLWLRDPPNNRSQVRDAEETTRPDGRERHPSHKKHVKKRMRVRPSQAPPAAHFASSSNRLFQPPVPLCLNPPVAHSVPSPVMPPLFDLPFDHGLFHPLASHHQQLRARSRTVLPPGDAASPFAGQFPGNPSMQANTVMLPYPLFVPLPVPIPIPIPLHKFLPREKATCDSEAKCEPSSTNDSKTQNSSSSEDESATARAPPSKKEHSQ